MHLRAKGSKFHVMDPVSETNWPYDLYFAFRMLKMSVWWRVQVSCISGHDWDRQGLMSGTRLTIAQEILCCILLCMESQWKLWNDISSALGAVYKQWRDWAEAYEEIGNFNFKKKSRDHLLKKPCQNNNYSIQNKYILLQKRNS